MAQTAGPSNSQRSLMRCVSQQNVTMAIDNSGGSAGSRGTATILASWENVCAGWQRTEEASASFAAKARMVPRDLRAATDRRLDRIREIRILIAEYPQLDTIQSAGKGLARDRVVQSRHGHRREPTLRRRRATHPAHHHAMMRAQPFAILPEGALIDRAYSRSQAALSRQYARCKDKCLLDRSVRTAVPPPAKNCRQGVAAILIDVTT